MSDPSVFDDDALLRYNRQIMLPEVDAEGQVALANATALIVGLGGLGSPASLYLAAAGVGRLILADPDVVELSNLQRQIAHGTPDIGRPKTDSAMDAIHHLNPRTETQPWREELTAENLPEVVKAADVVLDGCDNFTTRYAVNAACMEAGRPLISAAVIRWELQLAVFRGDQGGQPCYRCLYPPGDEPLDNRQTCSETGVIAPLPGVGGSLQALEAIKRITGAGETLDGRLWVMDALSMRTRTLHVAADPDCPVCAGTGQ